MVILRTKEHVSSNDLCCTGCVCCVRIWVDGLPALEMHIIEGTASVWSSLRLSRVPEVVDSW